MKETKLAIKEIALDMIDPNPENSKLFNLTDIEHLAKIIEEEGFTDPIEVYLKDDKRYEITSGHRRYAAMKLLGSETIPCCVSEKYKSDTQKSRKLLSSNIATRKLTPLEMANAISFYKAILKKEKFKGDVRKKTAEYFNISDSNVYRYECLLKLIPELQEYCKKPQFPYSSLSKASSLTPDEQRLLYKELISIESRTNNISEDEVDKDEIVFSRTRVEQIINATIRKNSIKLPESNIPKKEITNDASEDFMPLPEAAVEEKDGFLQSLIVKEDDTPVLNVGDYKVTNDDNSTDTMVLYEVDTCIKAINDCIGSVGYIMDKKSVKKKIMELSKAVEKIGNML